MGILKRIAGFLGLAKEESLEARDEEDGDLDVLSDRVSKEGVRLPRRGFSVPAQMTVDRDPIRPVIIPCSSGDGGLQGLRWHSKRLRVDEDGDVADEFLGEVRSSVKTEEDKEKSFLRFESNCGRRAAKVMQQALSRDGRIQHCIEQQGRLLWV